MRSFSQAQALIAESVLLDSRLALFHERENWLAVADLHFGYELSQRVAGRLVPFWGMESIEARLCQLLRDYRPATLILLGDLVSHASSRTVRRNSHRRQSRRSNQTYRPARFLRHGPVRIPSRRLRTGTEWLHPDYRAFSSRGDVARWRGITIKISRAGAGIGLLDFAGVFAVGPRNRVDRA